jgi:hypothetical protein
MATSARLVADLRRDEFFSFRRALRRPSRCVRLWATLGLAILCTVRVAHAERAIVVDAVDAPFAASELATAIRFRVPADGESIRIRVTATERGVQIQAVGGVREIDLLGLRGPAAARLVALAANDLLPDDLASPASPAMVSVRLPARATRPDDVTLGLVGAAAVWDLVLGNLVFDVAIPHDRWLVAFELGGGALMNSSVHLAAAIVRADAGVRIGALEARLGLTAVPVIVTDGAGDQTVLLGANGSLRARIPLAVGVRGILSVGGDVFATRTVYRVDARPALTTPRVAPWIAAGLEVAL